MKILLAILLCPVLIASQCFAIDGGPVYTRGRAQVTGIYSGVFLPPTTGTPPMETDDSMAIFTVNIPNQGLGSGTYFVVRNGNFYPGTMQATADPDSARLYAILAASFTIFVVIPFGDDQTYTYSANGRISRIEGVRITPNTNPFSSASLRLRGSARITFNTDDPLNRLNPGEIPPTTIHYKVIGFKQAETSG